MWRGYYLDPLTGTRRRKAIQAKRRPDLKQKVEQWQAEQKAGMGGTRIKVRDWCHLWLNKILADAVKPRTWDNYAITVRNHIIPQWGDLWIDKLTTAAIQIYLSDLLSDHTARTVRTIRTHIIACLGAAVDFGYLASNSAKKTRGPQVGKSGTVALTHEQARALLETAKSGTYMGMPRNGGSDYLRRCYYCVVLLALTSGMREGEIFALQWDKINFRQKKLLIACSLSNSRKAGLKISTTKTKRSNRAVTLPAQTMDELKSWRSWQESYAEKYRGIYCNDKGLVFTNPSGNQAATVGCQSDNQIGNQTGNQRVPQVRLGKYSIGKYRIGEERMEQSDDVTTTPCHEILSLYHSLCPSFRPAKVLTSRRMAAIEALYALLGRSMGAVKGYFQRCADTPFLCGENRMGWVANLDFLLDSGKYANIMAGKYDDDWRDTNAMSLT